MSLAAKENCTWMSWGDSGGAENGAGGAQNGCGRMEADQPQQMLALQVQLATQCNVQSMSRKIRKKHMLFNDTRSSRLWIQICVDSRFSLQLQDKQTIKKLELLQSNKWPKPVRYAQTHVHFIIYGTDMKTGLVVARERFSLRAKREEGWSINIIEERLFGIVLLRLFELASHRK